MRDLKERSPCMYMDFIRRTLQQGNYISVLEVTSILMPSADTTRSYLEKTLKLCSDRSIRLIEVENVDSYRVFICIPNGKSECDYVIWRYSPDLTPDLKIPTHDDLGREYVRLKKLSLTIEEHLVNCIIRLIKDRWTVDKILQHYFASLPSQLAMEVKKFLVTLKWISLQEDVNYPPPSKLGSKYTLAVYLLLEGGFELKDIRRLLRF